MENTEVKLINTMMVARDINTHELSRLVGMNYHTLRRKLLGERPLRRREAKKIVKVLEGIEVV